MEIAKTLQSSTRPDSVLSRAEIDAAVKYAEVNKVFSNSTFFLYLVVASAWFLQLQKKT